jgi:ribosome biogenesis GTPase
MTDAARSEGMVLHGTGGVWCVRLDDGTEVDASLRGRVKHDESAGARKLAVGDRVCIERDDRDSAWVIAEILPRRSALLRRNPAGALGERVMVANLDQVVVVFAAAQPEPHPRMLDRFLVIAEANSLRAVIVINKIDIVPACSAEQRFAVYGRIGYRLVFTSAKRGDGLDEMRTALSGRISSVSGPSGVGKSSLLNSLYPGLSLPVGEISASVNKGRHTTVGARALPLPGSGYVVDTPGLRELGIWGLDERYLDGCFPEMRDLISECRFKDCAHIAEPACAVREALRLGQISPVRYDSYLRLRSELAQLAQRL